MNPLHKQQKTHTYIHDKKMKKMLLLPNKKVSKRMGNMANKKWLSRIESEKGSKNSTKMRFHCELTQRNQCFLLPLFWLGSGRFTFLFSLNMYLFLFAIELEDAKNLSSCRFSNILFKFIFRRSLDRFVLTKALWAGTTKYFKNSISIN